MAVSCPEARGFVDRDSWLFVNDVACIAVPGDFGYHSVSEAQATVLLDWNQMFTHHLLLVPMDEE